MRNIILILFIFISLNAVAETNDAYIILKASSSGFVAKATRICMARNGACLHVPADESIIRIASGTYTVNHVDFANAPHNGDGKQSANDPIKVKLKRGKIYFIGELQVNKKGGRKYKMSLNQDVSLVHQACVSAPELFRKYPLTNPINQEEVKYVCSD